MARPPKQSIPTARRRVPAWLVLALLVAGLPGCSVGVMLGMMVMGRPLIPAALETMTGKSLAEEGKKVVVVCRAPQTMGDSALSIDLLTQVSRKLKLQEIDLVDPHKVATWVDDHGGTWDDVQELVDEFEADYVVAIEVDEFSYREINSPEMFRGRSKLTVRVYESQELDGVQHVPQIFYRPMESLYPLQKPVPVDRQSPRVFRRRYLDRLSDQIARLFYEHRPETTID